MVALLLLALGGCWSQRKVHDIEVWVDDPGAVSVGVVTDTGVAESPLPSGEGDASGAVAISGRTLELARSSTGVVLTCASCGPRLMLVDAKGHVGGMFQRDEVDLSFGDPVVLRRRYELTRSDEDLPRVTLELGTEWARVTRIEAQQSPKRGLGWIGVTAGLVATIPALYFFSRDEPVAGAATLGGSVALFAWGGVAAFRQRRQVILFEAGDTAIEPRAIDD